MCFFSILPERQLLPHSMTQHLIIALFFFNLTLHSLVKPQFTQRDSCQLGNRWCIDKAFLNTSDGFVYPYRRSFIANCYVCHQRLCRWITRTAPFPLRMDFVVVLCLFDFPGKTIQAPITIKLNDGFRMGFDN